MRLSTNVLESYPSVDEDKVNKLLNEELKKINYKLVVLDDDPTGVQTVHDISVYTHWDEESMEQAFNEEQSLFYILTNSRGLTQEKTTKIHHEIAEVIDKVSKKTHKKYIYLSRSDSTLRGHYPLETELLKEDYEKYNDVSIDGEVLCPFFKEGGRYTIDNIHYVQQGDELVSANETEFAQDQTFGYKAETLNEYVEEKTNGKYKKEDVVSISLDDLRSLNLDKIEDTLMNVHDFNKVIVNAIDYVDIKIFSIALLRALSRGKMFMFRCAAALVKVMGGISDKALLTRDDMMVRSSNNGGIIVVGSHTAKTNRQIDQLRQLNNLEFVELNANLVFDEEAFEAEVKRCLDKEEMAIRQGKSVCCYSSRKLITANSDNKEDDLLLSVKISDALQSLVGRLTVIPSFVIGKGGITSSDIGTKALKVKRANVLGQIKPGIPVWQTGEESKFPQTPYVIFPGNVGEDETLREAVEILTAK